MEVKVAVEYKMYGYVTVEVPDGFKNASDEEITDYLESIKHEMPLPDDAYYQDDSYTICAEDFLDRVE